MTNLGLERSIVELGLGFQGGSGDRFVMEKLNELGWTWGGDVRTRDLSRHSRDW